MNLLPLRAYDEWRGRGKYPQHIKPVWPFEQIVETSFAGGYAACLDARRGQTASIEPIPRVPVDVRVKGADERIGFVVVSEPNLVGLETEMVRQNEAIEVIAVSAKNCGCECCQDVLRTLGSMLGRKPA